MGFCAAQSVGSEARPVCFAFQAPAGLRFPHEVASGYLLSRSAVANDVPDKLLVPIFVGKRFGNKPSKSTPGEIVHYDSPLKFNDVLYRTLKESA